MKRNDAFDHVSEYDEYEPWEEPTGTSWLKGHKNNKISPQFLWDRFCRRIRQEIKRKEKYNG